MATSHHHFSRLMLLMVEEWKHKLFNQLQTRILEAVEIHGFYEGYNGCKSVEASAAWVRFDVPRCHNGDQTPLVDVVCISIL